MVAPRHLQEIPGMIWAVAAALAELAASSELQKLVQQTATIEANVRRALLLKSPIRCDFEARCACRVVCGWITGDAETQRLESKSPMQLFLWASSRTIHNLPAVPLVEFGQEDLPMQYHRFGKTSRREFMRGAVALALAEPVF